MINSFTIWVARLFLIQKLRLERQGESRKIEIFVLFSGMINFFTISNLWTVRGNQCESFPFLRRISFVSIRFNLPYSPDSGWCNKKSHKMFIFISFESIDHWCDIIEGTSNNKIWDDGCRLNVFIDVLFGVDAVKSFVKLQTVFLSASQRRHLVSNVFNLKSQHLFFR